MHELFQADLFHFQLIQKVYGIIQNFKNQNQVNFVGHNILGYDEHILSSCLHNACFFLISQNHKVLREPTHLN